MNKLTLILLVGALAGCGQSAQEKLAEEQLKAIEQQKTMQEALMKSAREELKNTPPPTPEKQVYKKWNLYPPK